MAGWLIIAIAAITGCTAETESCPAACVAQAGVCGISDKGCLTDGTCGSCDKLPACAASNFKAECAALADVDLPPRMRIPGFNGQLTVNVALGVSGHGVSRVGAITLDSSEGTVVIDRAAYSAFVVGQTTIKPLLYEVIAAAPDNIYVMWLYCDESKLQRVWLEGTNGFPAGLESASGSCIASGRSSAPMLHAPAIDMAWPRLRVDVKIAGDSLRLSLPSSGSSPGSIIFDGELHALLPFAFVNCSQCDSTGWYEVHSLLWNPRTGNPTIGILYLYPTDPERVLLQYTLALPSMKRRNWIYYRATWTKT
jgi:hypothetical protein